MVLVTVSIFGTSTSDAPIDLHYGKLIPFKEGDGNWDLFIYLFV